MKLKKMKTVAECWTCGWCRDGSHGMTTRCRQEAGESHLRPMRLSSTNRWRHQGHDVREPLAAPLEVKS